MKLYEIVFSATGRTQKVVDVISSVFTEEKEKIDLGEINSEEKIYNISEDSICIIAVPVYNGRVPIPAVNRLRNIYGNNANALLVAVYGNKTWITYIEPPKGDPENVIEYIGRYSFRVAISNDRIKDRGIDDCLLELKDILTEQGFKCRVAISAVAEHSMFTQFGSNRPDNDDQSELRKYTKQIKEQLETNTLPLSVNVPGKHPYVKTPNLPLKIKTNQNCIKCGKCAKECPVSAIPLDKPNCTDSKKCITCMRCISNCPQKARALPPVLVSIAGVVMKSKLGGYKKNTLYI